MRTAEFGGRSSTLHSGTTFERAGNWYRAASAAAGGGGPANGEDSPSSGRGRVRLGRL